MVVVLTGGNYFALTSELKKLTSQFVGKYGDLALQRLDGEEVEFNQVQEALTSLPFLASAKMVVFKSPLASKKFTDTAEKLIADLPDTTELVLVQPKFDKRSALYKLLQKTTDFRQFNELSEQQLASWLVERAKEQGASLSKPDANFLIGRVGANQQMLALEIDKLAQFSNQINRQSIADLVAAAPQSTIFDLVDAAFANNPRRVMELYHQQRQLKVDPSQIIAMLSWQLHMLALVLSAPGQTAGQIAGRAKLSEFPIKKSQRLAARLSKARLKKIVDELLQIDSRSKRQSIDLDEALQTFLLKLSQPAERQAA